MGRSRYRIHQDQVPYFHTCTVVGWLPVFTRQETAQVLLDSFSYLQTHDAFSLYGFVLLENHIHFVSGAQNHASCIKRFKFFHRPEDYRLPGGGTGLDAAEAIGVLQATP